MAVYKLFSEKDATILSQYPAQNTGRDEILDISNVFSKDYMPFLMIF